ncbi:MAG: ribonuclease P protein component, partial [Proteobacteria bacterium]|nr:ribonuclease P protein component [Pseudomonadota bacterium]
MTAPVIERLRTRAQFLAVRGGPRAVRATLRVEAMRRAEGGPIGLGLTATRKIGGAVARNRARRRLREAARELLPKHGLLGVDYVLVARQAAPDAPWPALLDDLQNALIRLAAALESGEPQPPEHARHKR